MKNDGDEKTKNLSCEDRINNVDVIVRIHERYSFDGKWKKNNSDLKRKRNGKWNKSKKSPTSGW